MTSKEAVATLAVVVLALLACKEEAETKKAPAPAVAAPPAATASAAPKQEAKSSAPQVFVKAAPAKKAVQKGVPDIPTSKSDPPKGSEWDQGIEVNTQGATSRPPDCAMHVLREWLSVFCSGDVTGFEKMEDFGREGYDYYMSIRPGKHAHLVVRLKQGKSQKIRICRKGNRASLFVNWPGAAAKPRHIALGKGPECDGSDWGAFQKKKGTVQKGGERQSPQVPSRPV